MGKLVLCRLREAPEAARRLEEETQLREELMNATQQLVGGLGTLLRYWVHTTTVPSARDSQHAGPVHSAGPVSPPHSMSSSELMGLGPHLGSGGGVARRMRGMPIPAIDSMLPPPRHQRHRRARLVLADTSDKSCWLTWQPGQHDL